MILAIPTMTKRDLARVRRSALGLPGRTLRPITYRTVYKAKWGPSATEDVCAHRHRTVDAAEACLARTLRTRRLNPVEAALEAMRAAGAGGVSWDEEHSHLNSGDLYQGQRYTRHTWRGRARGWA